jgi:O-antigen/teichoic acid export membrane protein
VGATEFECMVRAVDRRLTEKIRMSETFTETSVGTDALNEQPLSNRRFSTNVVLTFGTRLITIAAALVTSIIAARKLGPNGFGLLAVLNVILAISVQIGSAGLPSANTYFLSGNRGNLRRLAIISLEFGLLAGIILLVVIILLARLRPSIFGSIPLGLITVAVVSIPFQLLTLLGLNLFLAMGDIDRMNLIDGGGQLVLLLNAVIVLVVWNGTLNALVAANTFAAIVIALVVIALLGKRIVHVKRADGPVGPHLFRQLLRYSFKFHISIAAAIVIVRADLLLVNHFRGASEAGPYALAAQIGSLLLLLPAIISILLFPRVAAEPDARAHFTMRVTRHTVLIMLVACLATVPLSFMLPVVYGEAFREAALLLLMLLPGIYLLGIESVMVQHFTGTGLPIMVPLFWLIALVFNIALNFILIPGYGARAAALTSTLTYGLIFLLVASYFRRQTGSKFSQVLLMKRSELSELPALVRLGPFAR